MAPPATLLPVLLAAALGAGEETAIEIRAVAPGVYAALQPEAGRFDDANSAIIVTGEGVVVVDTQTAPAGARAVLARVRALSDEPVETVVLTHWHSDHVAGSSVYRDAFPGVRLLAHRNTREDIVARAIPDHREELETLPGRLEAAEQQLVTGLRRDGGELTDEQRQQLREAIDRRRAHLERVREVELVLPDAVFDERLTLYRGDTEIRLMHFPGHTRGDVVVFLPRERVLISGDLLDDLPYTGHGSPAALVETLRHLERLEFDHVIPGHGRVREGKAHLRRVAELFEALVEQVAAARVAGRSLEETRAQLDVSAFREYFVTDAAAERYWDFFIPEAIGRAWEEAAEPGR
jgi:glyoxylase-like metal-dependent hydrolase (beta-lactamase superfamily II)